MAQPFEQDIILDADGRPLFSAFEYVERQVANLRTQINQIGRDSYKNVQDAGKVIDMQVRDLQRALSQMRTLAATPGASKQGDFIGASKERERQLKEEGRVSKAVYGQQVTDRRQSLREIAAAEREGAKAVADLNRQRTQQEIEGAKLLAKNRLEAAKAGLVDDAKRISNLEALARARADNIDKLQRYRAAAKAESDPTQARALATLIELEKARGAALDATNRKLEQQQRLATQRLMGLDTRQAKALAGSDVRGMVSAVGDATAVRVNLLHQQELARRQLMVAVTEQERIAALSALDIANKRVDAINRIVAAEERALSAQRREGRTMTAEQQRAQLALSSQYARQQIGTLGVEQALANQKARQVQAEEALAAASNRTRASLQRTLDLENARLRAMQQQAREQQNQNSQRGGGPVSNILSPGYAAAAFARTSVYGVAAMGAYSVFNTIQNSLSNVVQMEDELHKLQAIANATDGQMHTLTASIFSIGEASRFSIVELIQISKTLAQAGITAVQMEDVLRAVTTLATSSGSTAQEAADLVTASMGAFQLSGSEAARIADLMTAALNRTRLTVQQTALAIQYVGATAYEQNISLEQLLSTIGAVAQAGVRSGSTIGTGFRQFLVDLANPSEKLTKQLTLLGITASDVDVSVKGLPAVLEKLRDAGFGATSAYEGLELRAAAFYLVAKNNVDVMDQLQLAFAQSGSAAIANERAMNTLTAQWQRFKNIMAEGFAESAQGILNVVKSVLTSISDSLIEMRTYEEQQRKKLAAGPVEGFGGGVGGYLNYAVQYDVRPAAEFAIEKGLNAFNPSFLWDTDKMYLESGPGTWLKNLGRDASDTTDAMEALETQINTTNETLDSQRSLVAEVDKELMRLITQKESLRDNDARSAAEMVTLMSRFQGLAVYLTNTGNMYDDLTQAVRRYRLEQMQVLGTTLVAQNTNLQLQTSETKAAAGQQVRGIQSDPKLMAKLTPQERAALSTLMTPNQNMRTYSQAQGIIADASSRLSANDRPAAQRLNSIVQAVGTISSNIATMRANTATIASNTAAQSDLGQRVTNGLMEVESSIIQLGSQANKTDDKKAMTTRSMSMLSNLENEITQKLKGPLDAGTRSYLTSELSRIPALRTQISSANVPTGAETKADAKAERDRKKAEREAAAASRARERAERLVTQADLDAVGAGILGKGSLGSGVRSAAEQNSLHARGLTPATAGTSSHSNGGLARDFRTGAISLAEGKRLEQTFRQAYKNAGIEAFVQYETGKGKNQGSGPHIHVSVPKGTRKRGTGPDGAVDGTAESEFQYETKLAKAQLDLDEESLTQRLKALTVATTKETFDAAVTSAKEALDKVNDGIRTVALNELANEGIFLDSVQAQAKMAQVNRTIEQNVVEFQTKIANAIIKSTQMQMQAAERAFESSIAPAERDVTLAESRLQGLGYESLNGRVPTFVTQAAERRAAQAREAADRTRLAAMPTLITSQEGALAGERAKLATMSTDDAGYSILEADISKLSLALDDLKTKRDALAEALGAGGLIPTDLGQGLRMAIEGFREANHLSNTFAQDLMMNLDGALTTIHTGLSDMFLSIMDGSRTAMQAFGDFAKSIMKYIMQIVAKIIASKIIGLLLDIGMAAFGPRSSGSTSSMGSTDPTQGAIGMFKGGSVEDNLPGYAGGGEVMNGSVTHDSVLAKIARGEWMVRREAVQSVGPRFMAKLNRYGAKALDTTNQMPKIDVRPRMESNIWMIKPEDRPQMGPNDVLITWAQDVLSGGESRKLIRHVATEG